MNTMTMKTPSSTPGKPWYKEPWPWVLISIPMMAVIMGVVLINLAIQSEDGLVVDDYYWKGKQINQVLERDQRASALGIDSVLTLLPADNQIELRIVDFADGAPEAMTIKFLHATRSGFDREAHLERTGADRYTATLPDLAQGRWNIELSAADWRVMGSLSVPNERSVRLTAAR